MQTGAVETVLAEPGLAQGEVLAFILTRGWGRTENGGEGLEHCCALSPSLVCLSWITAGRESGCLTRDHLSHCPTPGSPQPLAVSLNPLYLELGSSTCCALLGAGGVETSPSRESSSLPGSLWPAQPTASLRPVVQHPSARTLLCFRAGCSGLSP